MPSHDSRIAVGGEGHGTALLSVPHGARADQLGSLLGPDSSAPGPDPRGPSLPVIKEPADDGRVTVSGEGYGNALQGVPRGVWADQLGPLLSPDSSAPRPNPSGTGVAIVLVPSDDSRVAISGKRHIGALQSGPYGARPHQLRPLLRELREGWMGRKQRGADEYRQR